MDGPNDTYRTLAKPSPEVLVKEKKSKFISQAYPIKTEEEVKALLDQLRKKYPNANHLCYAWQLGLDNPRYRANDDGEPNNSAGKPIYGQLVAFNLTNVLVVVARIFGGTKLGVGGLIGAYREAAQKALSSSEVIVKTNTKNYEIRCAYPEMNVVLRLLRKHNYAVISQQLELDCRFIVAIPKSKLSSFENIMRPLHKAAVRRI